MSSPKLFRCILEHDTYVEDADKGGLSEICLHGEYHSGELVICGLPIFEVPQKPEDHPSGI